MIEIDINCDVGEGIGNDADIMPYISSCNIACGAHAGDLATMKKTIALAIKHNVKIGAHPSYPDRENFGRKTADMPFDILTLTISEQIKVLKSCAESLGGNLNHAKPHGALYNEAYRNEDVAKAIVIAVKSFRSDMSLYAPFGSLMAKLAHENGINVKHEGFADRAYQDNLELVNRSIKGSVLYDKEEIYEHVLKMITKSQVQTISGNWQQIKADTICVHGDNPEAVGIVKHLSEKLTSHGIRIN